MKNLLVLAICAFIAAPAFADNHEAKTAAPATTEATEHAAAPTKEMKKKKKKMAKKAAHGTEAPAADAPKAE